MKLTIERSALLKALAHVQSVVERRNTIPILANVLLDAQKPRLSLAATDMDIAIVETVPADVAKAGTITVPAHTLYEIVRKLPEGSQVGIETIGDKGQVSLRAGRSSFALATLPTRGLCTITQKFGWVFVQVKEFLCSTLCRLCHPKTDLRSDTSIVS